MAIISHRVFLMKDYQKLIDIKAFPDLGGAPEMLETTTLSDKMQTYIPGIQASDALEFTTNYTLEDYETLKALENKEIHYAIWFGGIENNDDVLPTGEDGVFSMMGYLSVYVNGGGVNEVVEMTITIAPSSGIYEGDSFPMRLWRDDANNPMQDDTGSNIYFRVTQSD